MKNLIRVVVLGGTAALALAACGSAPSASSSSSASASTSSFKACMVSDAGGFDDKSFNQSGYEGLQKAGTDLGVEVKAVESKQESDYTPNVESLISEKCDLIIGVGYLLEPAIHKAAEANPDIEFGLVDSSFSDADGNAVTLDNAKPLLFDTAQAAYLAGYLAAGVSKTGTVGTFGGMAIPSVTIFMDGYVDGVAKYNEDNGKAVKVLGWDKAAQTGSFTGTFDDQSTGQTQGQALLDQGADIIMPVAGPVGLGTVAAINSANNGSMLIGVDSDWAVSNPDSASITLTSVIKEIGQSVYDTVQSASEGNFTSDPYVGTLKNGGVGLADFHDLASSVPSDLSTQVDTLKQDIIDGTITVTSASTPK
ncbi:MAG: BMP family ABC transporter substrate-binding protein [Actinobacteria bacterium]|nr:BMP family ABC transporter substrate-binding protein [Actinomycetota bacterium]MCG2797005.1 BMP family ABC transporter substrate-binding protein [Cellulomonas sp.]